MPLPNNKILNSSKLKASADENIIDLNVEICWEWDS